jgi:beta-N-acetylhexosaminidase
MRQIVAAVAAGAIVGLVVLGVIGKGKSTPESVVVSPDTSKAVKGLSDAEKVDEVMAVGFEGTGAPEISKTQGGVLLSAANWRGLGAGRGLTRALHKAGGEGSIPPLVIGDQEGGVYRAYPDLPPAERELDLGDADDPAKTEAWAKQAGTALHKAGFDLNVFPVADVATLDSPIADRAFSDDPHVAARMTAAAVRGCHQAQILCAVSHFPGAGDESQDTSDGPATVSLHAHALARRDLLPFVAAFKANAPAVLLSHAFYAAYDPVTPGSISPAVIGEVLRKQLGFKGAALTDDLSAGAIRGGDGAADASVQAIAAGADMVLVSDPADAAAARDALLGAVKKGGIPQARLDAAVSRVLELKRSQGLLPS